MTKINPTDWPWWVEANERRCALINKRYSSDGPLTQEEHREYAILSCLADMIVNLVVDVPSEGK